MLLKTVVAVLCVAQIVVAGDFEAELRVNYTHVKEQCLSETGVNHDLIDKVNEGVFTEDTTLINYMTCLFDGICKFDADGSLNIDSVMAVIPDEHRDTYVHMVRECATTHGVDKYDTSFKMHLCWHKANPDLHFIL